MKKYEKIISIKKLISEIIFNNIKTITDYKIIDDINQYHQGFNLLHIILIYKLDIKNITHVIDLGIDINAKINKNLYTYSYKNGQTYNLKKLNSLFLATLNNNKINIIDELLESGIDWKNGFLDDKCFIYYLNEKKRKIIFKLYPEIQDFYERKQQLNNFNI